MLIVSVACHPEVKRWYVKPHAYCSTTSSIHVEWEGDNGATTVEITPVAVAGRAGPKVLLRDVNKGVLDIEPAALDLAVEVSDGARRERRVTLVRPINDLTTLDGRGHVCEGNWMVSTPFTYGGGQAAFPKNARLATISNRCAPGASATATCRRKVDVVQGSKQWHLAPGETLDVGRDGARLGSQWILKQTLLPGEVCGHQSALPAVDIALSITTVCTE